MGLRRKAVVEEAVVEEAVVEEAVVEEAVVEEDLPFDGDAKEAAVEAAEEEKKVKEAQAEVGNGLVPRKEPGALAPAGKTTVSSDAKLSSQLEEAGFGGLDDGFGAYPIISLKNEGVFEDTDGESWGTEFTGVIIGGKPKYVVANTRCEKRDEEVVYTFDQENDTQGVPLKETLQKWADQGWGYEIRPYTDVMFEVAEGDRSGEVVILSLPKTSRTKYTGYTKTNMRRHRALPDQYLTQVRVGDKIQNVDFPYYPWKFKFAGMLEE